jgi:hypothetical protein
MIQLIAWLLSQRLFWAALAVVGGPALFVRGFRLLQRRRLIADIPRSTIRSAALGPIEISGKAVGPYTLVAPISRSDCLYYRVAVQSNPRADQKNWKMRELCAPLFLDDGTGKVMIYPAHCDLQIEASDQREDWGKVGLALAGLPLGDDAEFLQEYCIRPGDQLFVLGDLQENPWVKCDESSELSRIGPGFVSQDEADLLRKEVFPVLEKVIPAGIAVPAPEFDYHPSVILMKGRGPFVISTESQREIVAELGWKSFLYVWGGPAAALWGLWEILSHAKTAGIVQGNF